MAVFTHITEDDLKNFLRNYNFNNIDFIEGINVKIQTIKSVLIRRIIF